MCVFLIQLPVASTGFSFAMFPILSHAVTVCKRANRRRVIVHHILMDAANHATQAISSDTVSRISADLAERIRAEVSRCLEQEQKKLNSNAVKQLKDYLETAISTLSCSICYEIMIPPERVWYL